MRLVTCEVARMQWDDLPLLYTVIGSEITCEVQQGDLPCNKVVAYKVACDMEGCNGLTHHFGSV